MEGIHRKGRSEKDEGRSRKHNERKEQDLEEAGLARPKECSYIHTPVRGNIPANRRHIKALAGIRSISTLASPATHIVPLSGAESGLGSGLPPSLG
jgi:hypothetical protein